MPQRNSEFRQAKFIDPAVINRFLTKLESRMKIEALIVFGSRARGDAFYVSDYDIAVISAAFQGSTRPDRIFLLLDNWDADLPLEPVAYTPEELTSARGLLIWDILDDGVVFKDTGVFKQKKALHEELKESGRLKKVEGGWKTA